MQPIFLLILGSVFSDSRLYGDVGYEYCSSGAPRSVIEYGLPFMCMYTGWWRGTVIERRSLTGELSLSCARPAADG